jgi:hypothetical protein
MYLLKYLFVYTSLNNSDAASGLATAGDVVNGPDAGAVEWALLAMAFRWAATDGANKKYQTQNNDGADDKKNLRKSSANHTLS